MLFGHHISSRIQPIIASLYQATQDIPHHPHASISLADSTASIILPSFQDDPTGLNTRHYIASWSANEPDCLRLSLPGGAKHPSTNFTTFTNVHIFFTNTHFHLCHRFPLPLPLVYTPCLFFGSTTHPYFVLQSFTFVIWVFMLGSLWALIGSTCRSYDSCHGCYRTCLSSFTEPIFPERP